MISSIQSLTAELGPAPALGACLSRPCLQEGVCRHQLASCPPRRHQVGFFCSSRLTKALARALQVLCQWREQHPAAHMALPLLPFTVPNGELQGVWAGEAVESQALKTTENKNNFLPWTTVERPFQVCSAPVGWVRSKTALSGAVAADTQWLDYEHLSQRQNRQSKTSDF